MTPSRNTRSYTLRSVPSSLGRSFLINIWYHWISFDSFWYLLISVMSFLSSSSCESYFKPPLSYEQSTSFPFSSKVIINIWYHLMSGIWYLYQHLISFDIWNLIFVSSFDYHVNPLSDGPDKRWGVVNDNWLERCTGRIITIETESNHYNWNTLEFFAKHTYTLHFNFQAIRKQLDGLENMYTEVCSLACLLFVFPVSVYLAVSSVL